jgi:AcrR family transcriptional regulator
MPLPRKRSPARVTRSSRRVPETALPDSRRREILTEAVRLMEEKGFAAMSVRHVADALDFSKANFYHHIDSKEDLLNEIFIDTLQYSLSHIEEIMASEQSLPDQLRALVAFYVSLMLDRRAVMLVWFKERAHLTEAHQKEVGRLEHAIGALLERFYASGMKTGDFKTMAPELLRLAIFGLCFQLTKLPRRPDRASAADITRQLQELACGGLLTPNRPPA